MADRESGMSSYGQRLDSSYGQRLETAESTQSLLSRRGSDFGNRYVQVDDAGIYLSSLAVTIILSSVATIGILLLTLVITLVVMVGSCQSQPMYTSPFLKTSVTGAMVDNDTMICSSLRLNMELNNVQGLLLPPGCQGYVADYMLQGQYSMDYEQAVDAARSYLKTIPAQGDQKDAIILDIDDTVLTNVPYYVKHHFGAEGFDENAWNQWVEERDAPALEPILNMYNELQAANWSIIFITGRPEQQRNATEDNLRKAGFSGWASLNLRSKTETGTTAVQYKSARRILLESEGYRIWTSIGDQWSDLEGPAVGSRTFKLPNPMYYIY